MKLEELQSRGGIVSDELVKRTGDWDGEAVEFYVRKLSFGDVDRIYNGGNLDASQAAELISKAIRLGDDGEETLTYQQAYSLTPSLATIFAEAVMDVNRVNDEAAASPKASDQKTNSGSK